MVGIRHILILLTLAAMSLGHGRAAPRLGDHASGTETSLFAQTATETFNHEFPGAAVSFLLLDGRDGRVLVSRWDQLDAAIPLGSLVKPFAALAYGEAHEFQYPNHTCRGTASGCWLPHGHGDLDLTDAIAFSCNSYFRMLTAKLRAVDVVPTAIRFGLEPPDQDAAGPALFGIGDQWRISPLRMSRAYLDLARGQRSPGVSQILEGMAQSARRGTGAEVGRALPFRSALVKTGTAMCTHGQVATGDGFAMVLLPADAPQIVLMVRVHGVPGAQAAKVAGQMLRRIGE